MGPRRVSFEARVDGKTQRFVAIARGGEVEIAFRDGRAPLAWDIPPTVLAVEDGVLVLNGGRQTHVAAIRPDETDATGEPTGDGEVVAPMHGRLIALAVSEGESVEAGQRLAVLEAIEVARADGAAGGAGYPRWAEGGGYGGAGGADSEGGESEESEKRGLRRPWMTFLHSHASKQRGYITNYKCKIMRID